MPIVTVRLPEGAFGSEERRRAVDGITAAVAVAEGIPDDPLQRAGIIVVWDELRPGAIHSNGVPVDVLATPVFVWVDPPAGVLDDERVAGLVADVDRCLREAYRGELALFTSVVVREVPDGRWGREGNVSHLADFARDYGYLHLQHLVTG